MAKAGSGHTSVRDGHSGLEGKPNPAPVIVNTLAALSWTMGILGRTMVTFLPLAPRFVVRWVAKRYMAGESLEQAIEVMEALSSEGACFTVDVLGEEI